jgi:cytochrome c oxidase subunit 1
MLITSLMTIFALPAVMLVTSMLISDRLVATHFFDAAMGGDVVLFQHIFWFFGHPEVYIIILPAFGIISEIIPSFSRKPLFGYASMVYAVAAIAILSFLVWAHHMFTTGMPAASILFYMYATMLIAVPTGVKVFNWLATMWKGAISLEAPMLFALGFLFLFVVGGFTGLILAIQPIDIQFQDTYYVVAHFHYVMVAGTLFAFFGGAYYWLPKWTGHMYNEKLADWHFWLSFIFFNVAFFPMHFLGLAGMPRRIPDYAQQFTDWNMVSTIGAFGFGLSQLVFLTAVVKCIRGGAPAPAKPWEGATTLEWTLPSPAPYHTFETPPVVK